MQVPSILLCGLGNKLTLFNFHSNPNNIQLYMFNKNK